MAKILPPSLSFEQALRAGYTGRIEFRPYLDWLKTLPCDDCGAAPPSDPSHLDTFKGQGTKSPDWLAIPQCRDCHEIYENAQDKRFRNERHLRRAVLYLLQAIYEGRLVWIKR